jgi:DNA repair ATPase RecN
MRESLEVAVSEALEKVQESIQDQASESRMNGFIALFVAIVATFMALCNVKDGNVVQAMQQAQAKAIDQWNFYQSKSTKQHIAENSAEMLKVQLEMNPGLKAEARAKVEARIASQEAAAKKYEKEKDQIRAEAEAAAKEYDALNVHDDQFDLAEACLSVGIALAGVTALTKKRWLFGVACVFASIGVMYGLAGFLHWKLHSDLMAKVLG